MSFWDTLTGQQPKPQNGYDHARAVESLKKLGYDERSEEFKMLSNFGEAVNASRPQAPSNNFNPLVPLLSGASAGLARLGGANHGEAVRGATDPINAHYSKLSDATQKAMDYGRDLETKILTMGLEGRQSQIARDRRQNDMRKIFDNTDTGLEASGVAPAAIAKPGDPPDASGGLPGAPPPPQAGPMPMPSPMAPPGMAGPGPVPGAPGLNVAPPAPASLPPQVAPQAAPQAIPGAAPRTDPGIVKKYGQVDLPYTQKQILEASMVDDKLADNLRMANDQALKQVEQMTKRHEIDPAKKAALKHAEITAEKQAEALADLPKSLHYSQMMLDDLDATIADEETKSVTGSIQGRWPEYLQTENQARAQSRITKVSGLAFLQAFQSIKGGGAITEAEGAKAQAALSRLGTQKMGDDDYMVALEEAKDEVKDLMNLSRRKAGVPEVDHRAETAAKAGQKPQGAAPGTPPGSPAAPAAVTPEQSSAIQQRLQAASPEDRAIMIKELEGRGIDPSTFMGPPSGGAGNDQLAQPAQAAPGAAPGAAPKSVYSDGVSDEQVDGVTPPHVALRNLFNPVVEMLRNKNIGYGMDF